MNLIHTNGEDGGYYPIDFRIYYRESDGKTKNDHFLEMLTRAVGDKRIISKTILFNKWYGSVENLETIHRMGLCFVTSLKSNRLVSPAGGFIRLRNSTPTPLLKFLSTFLCNASKRAPLRKPLNPPQQPRRPCAMTETNGGMARLLRQDAKRTVNEICHTLQISGETLYQYIAGS